jgi:hypothetical protein
MMTEKRFQIDVRHQYLSMRKVFAFLIWLVLMSIFMWWGFGADSRFLTGFTMISMVFGLPALYLHVAYFFQNRRWVLIVDESRNKIRIQIEDIVTEYTFEQVANCELNRGIHYKHKMYADYKLPIPSNGYWPMPWMEYGYLRVRFTDGRDFIFTSLMLDLTSSVLPAKTTRFRFIPYIQKNQPGYRDFKENLEEIKRGKILEYQQRFQKLPEEKLLEKINNPQVFEYEARVAASRIIAERKRN